MRPHYALLLCFCAAPACGDRAPRERPDDTAEVVVTDARGRTVRLESVPERVISLLPSVTETIVALGAGERLVARTAYDRDSSLRDLPVVGGGAAPNPETIVSLRPNLVIAWNDVSVERLFHELERLGIAVYAADVQTFQDIRRTITVIGRVLGRGFQADSLLGSIDAGVAEVHRRVEGRERPSVLYLIWPEPPLTAAGGSFVDELIELAGGRNVFKDVPSRWPTVSLEEILRRQPDVVVIADDIDKRGGIQWISQRPGWRELAAVRNHRVVLVPAALFNHPGPFVLDAARELIAAFHPELAFEEP